MDRGGGRRVGSSVEGWREGGESGQRGRSFPPKVSLSPKAAAVTLNDLRFAAPSTSGAGAHLIRVGSAEPTPISCGDSGQNFGI